MGILLELLLHSTFPAWAGGGEASILIRGGTVIDGTGTPGHRADLRLKGDRIVEVALLEPSPGERVLDATGLTVAPGFIDTHSHADEKILSIPGAASHVLQGITTAIGGQDGDSVQPLEGFVAKVEKLGIAPNLASFAGHGTLRTAVLGADFRRPATAEEIARMGERLTAEMKAGALGLSTGLEYDPGFYSSAEELIALARVAAAHHGLYISHMRSECDPVFDAIDELIGIAREAGIPAQVSHVKLASATHWGQAARVRAMLDEARAAKLDVSADVYPYRYWQSTITALVNSRDFEDRQVWQKGLDDVGGPANVRLSDYTPLPEWEGKTFAELAASTGRDAISLIQEVVRATQDPSKGEEESVIVTAMTEEDLRSFLVDPRIMICSDGTLEGTHPRGAGTFPRVLGRYVREEKVLALEEAIRKMTSLPASRMGMRDRGHIQPGAFADLVVFDPATVLDRATPEAPTAPPDGIRHVFVNGQLVVEDGKPTANRPGRFLRRTAAP